MDDLFTKELFSTYRQLADEFGFKKPRTITAARNSAATIILLTCGGIDAWTEAIDNVRKSHFLQGLNKFGWKPDIDWLLNIDNFVRVLEGVYENPASSQFNSTNNGPLSTAVNEVRRHLKLVK